jgi:hypothetical protein
VDHPGLGVGPSAVLTREGLSLRSPCVFVWTVWPGSADRPQVPNWIWAETVCFWSNELRTVRGLNPDSTISQVADRPALEGGPSARANQLGQGSGVFKLPGLGPSGRGRRTIRTCLFLTTLTSFKREI